MVQFKSSQRGSEVELHIVNAFRFSSPAKIKDSISGLAAIFDPCQ